MRLHPPPPSPPVSDLYETNLIMALSSGVFSGHSQKARTGDSSLPTESGQNRSSSLLAIFRVQDFGAAMQLDRGGFPSRGSDKAEHPALISPGQR
jgi:hypothetical protein